MITKTYRLALAGNKSVSKLVHAKDSRNTILAVDTAKLNGSKYNILYKKYDDKLRFAKVESKSIMGISIRSNSPDILITDIHVDGIPYYYKAPVRFKNADAIKIKGADANRDDNFVYSTSQSEAVIYRIGEKEMLIEEDFYPVYIKESDHFSKHISDIDNKVYSYSKDTNGDYIINCKNHNVSFSTLSGELTLISQYSKSNKNHLSFIMSEFSKERKVKIGNDKIILRYESEELISNIDTKVNERVFVSRNVIQLSDSNVLPSDISIKYVSGDSHVTISDIPKEAVISNKGQVIIDHISDMIPKEYDYILATYRFVSPRSNNIEIPLRVVNNSSIIKLYIHPSKIIVNENLVVSKSNIRVAAFDKTGICIYSNIHNLKRNPGIYNIWSNGEVALSGAIGDGTNNVDIHKDDIISIFELDKLENKIDGLLEVASITKKNVELDYAISSRVSIPKENTHGLRDLLMPKLSYVKAVLGENKVDSINSNVAVLNANISTNAIPSVYAKTDEFLDFKIDVSKDFSVSEFEYVEDESILRFLKYNVPKFANRSKDNYRVFAIGMTETAEIKPVKKVIIDNEIFFRVKMEDLQGMDMISVSYNDYPGLGVKIWEHL